MVSTTSATGAAGTATGPDARSPRPTPGLPGCHATSSPVSSAAADGVVERAGTRRGRRAPPRCRTGRRRRRAAGRGTRAGGARRRRSPRATGRPSRRGRGPPRSPGAWPPWPAGGPTDSPRGRGAGPGPPGRTGTSPGPMVRGHPEVGGHRPLGVGGDEHEAAPRAVHLGVAVGLRRTGRLVPRTRRRAARMSWVNTSPSGRRPPCRRTRPCRPGRPRRPWCWRPSRPETSVVRPHGRRRSPRPGPGRPAPSTP